MTKYHFPAHMLAETAYRKGGKTVPVGKKLLGGLTALAVALTLVLASAVPSRADKRGDDIAKILGAALIIGVIANSLDDKNDRKDKRQPRRAPQVPDVCAIEIGDNQNRSVVIYGERCLRHEGFDYRLPDCARSARIRGKRDWVYSAECLREAGFDTRRGYN